jgi:hypothetical protein
MTILKSGCSESRTRTAPTLSSGPRPSAKCSRGEPSTISACSAAPPPAWLRQLRPNGHSGRGRVWPPAWVLAAAGDHWRARQPRPGHCSADLVKLLLGQRELHHLRPRCSLPRPAPYRARHNHHPIHRRALTWWDRARSHQRRALRRCTHCLSLGRAGPEINNG